MWNLHGLVFVSVDRCYLLIDLFSDGGVGIGRGGLLEAVGLY